jgi:ABC-type transport system substrate-binding protein
MSEQNPWTRSVSTRFSRRRLVKSGVALAGLALTACASGNERALSASPTASSSPSAGAAATTPAAARPKSGGTIRSSANSAAPNYDPHATPGAGTFLNPLMAYSGLLKFKHGQGVQPTAYQPTGDLAESWEQPDDLTYIFKLRRGVKFQNIAPVNGRELSSADLLYSYQRVLDLKAIASLLAGVQKMETPDAYTFKVTLSEPNADFLVNLCAAKLVVVAKEAVGVNGDLSNGPYIGTSPWIVDSVDRATGVCVLVKNPDYFLKGLPYADRLVCNRIVDSSTLISAFRGKELDTMASGVLRQDIEPIRKANPTEILVTDVILFLASDELGFKADAPPFDDARVRKAVTLAMDREALLTGANAGFGILTSGVVTPDVGWQLSPEALKSLYKRDVAGARQLLTQAGVPNLEFELSVPTYKSQVYVTMGEQLQAQLKEAGITMRLKVMDPATYTGAVSNRGEFTAYLGNAGGRLTANQDLLSRLHSKGAVTRIQTHYNNPKLDELIDQQRVLSRDPARRRSLLEQIQRMVIEDSVLVSMAASVQPIVS